MEGSPSRIVSGVHHRAMLQEDTAHTLVAFLGGQVEGRTPVNVPRVDSGPCFHEGLCDFGASAPFSAPVERRISIGVFWINSRALLNQVTNELL